MKVKPSNYKFKTLCLDKKGQKLEQTTNQINSLIFSINQKIKLEMTEIPSGEFLMGSSADEIEFRENETPQHKVKISKHYLGKYPITQSQYLAVMNELPEMSEGFCGDDFSVVNVFPEKALEFCAKLSEITKREFRLPSEAEWEYACRAGTNTSFAFGETIMTDIANYDGNKPFANASRGKFRKGLTSVGHFKVANNFGLYDMHGSVWEWCADIWHADHKDTPTDGSAWVKAGDQSYVVQKDGDWNSSANACRSAFRVGDIAHNTDNIVGLRVCMAE